MVIVTDNHVVASCTKDEMLTDPWSASEQFGFTKTATDSDRDLPLLRPAKHLSGGLELAPSTDQDAVLETGVKIWGFLFRKTARLRF
jgi:hypothetical protein